MGGYDGYGVCGVVWRGQGRYVAHLTNGRQVELPKLE